MVDRRDCGAHKVLLGTEHLKTRATVKAARAARADGAARGGAKRHPELPAELLLMNLDGTVETIA